MAELRDAAVLVPVYRDAHGVLRIVVVARADDDPQLAVRVAVDRDEDRRVT